MASICLRSPAVLQCWELHSSSLRAQAQAFRQRVLSHHSFLLHRQQQNG